MLRRRSRSAEFAERARSLREAGRYRELEELYRDRGDRSDLCQLGWAIARQGGRDEEAAEVFRTALEKGVDPVMAHMNLGDIAEVAGHTEAAVEHFEIAMNRGQEDQAPARLANLLEDGPRDAEVDDLLRISIEHGHPSTPAYLARRLAARGELAEVEALYRLALERGHGPAPSAELACLLKMHEPDREAEATELVHAAIDQGIRADLLVTVVQQRVVSPDVGIRVLETALAYVDGLQPRDEEFGEHLREELGHMLNREGRFGDLEALDRSRLEAGDRSLLCKLAYSVAMQGREAEAVELYRAAVAEDVQPEHAHYNLGHHAECHDRIDEAIEHFETAARLGHRQAPARVAGLLQGGERDSEVEGLYRSALDHGDLRAAIDLAVYLRARAPERTADALRLVGLALEGGIDADALRRAVSWRRVDREGGAWVAQRAMRYAAHLGPDTPCGGDAFRTELEDIVQRTVRRLELERARGDADEPEAVGQGDERIAL